MGFEDLAKKAKDNFPDEKPDAAVKGCAPAAVKTGFGDAVDALAAKSPTLQENLKKLKEDRWTIEYGEAGKGSFCSKKEKKIILDPNKKDKPAAIVQTLAHESGHALYKEDVYVPPTGKTRKEYVEANAMRNLKDEGEATLVNCQVRKEILANGGEDIGVAGAQSAKYIAAAEEFPDARDRDKAREKIGNLFADGEHPSTAKDKTYRQYYEQPYADYYDANAVKK